MSGIIFDDRFGVFRESDDDYITPLDQSLQNTFRKFYLGIKSLVYFGRAGLAPKHLFIEPHRGCQLSCKFCYAEVWDDKKERLSIDQLVELDKKYQFTAISIHGGDPFYDKNYLKEIVNVFSDRKLELIYMSSNGVGITDDIMEFLKSRCEKLEIQFSVEPEWFGARVSRTGKHQNDLMDYKKLKNHFDEFAFTSVIPLNIKEPKSFDQALIDLQNLVQVENWKCKWNVESTYDNTDPNLPNFINDWYREEIFNVDSPEYDITRARKGLASNILDRLESRMKTYDTNILPTPMSTCWAGFGAISIAPSGKLYTCHVSAILENEDYLVEELTYDALWERDRKHIESMATGCEKCPDLYGCASVCFKFKADYKCKEIHLKHVLFAKIISKFDMENGRKIADKYKKFILTCNENLDIILPTIESDKWNRLIYGKLSKDDMLELYREYIDPSFIPTL